MTLEFTWNPGKAASNLRKHRVSFAEAKTVFSDRLSSTLLDDQHSGGEEASTSLASPRSVACSSSSRLDSTQASGSSVPASLPRLSANSMKKSPELDPLAPRPNLDFSKGVRGKYAARLQQGTNLVALDPDLLPHFPDSASVNRALHAFLSIHEQVQSAATSARTRHRTAPATSAEFEPQVGTKSASR